MKALKWILGIVAAVVLVSVVAGYGYLRSTLPDYDGEVTIPGIAQEVEIIRDSYGMPHIYAKTDQDGFFALGYSMAQDRLFHMDIVRRAARGKLAEVLGESLVPVDKLFRTITAAKTVEEVAADYSDEAVVAMKAYTKGVNYYLNNHGGALPIEFTILGYKPEPWDYTDGVAVHYYMAWDLNGAFDHEMLNAAVVSKVGLELASQLFPSYAHGYPTIVPDGTAALDFLKTLNLARSHLSQVGGGASNSWVISGKKSITGQPIMANDPHLGHGLPGIWYEAHMITPSLNVSGSYLPGMPFAVIGANQHIAWGFTNVMADDADFYIEKINPDNPDQYLFQGNWENMRVKNEIIKIKGGQEAHLKIKLTRHGPIIDSVNDYQEPAGTALAMRWTAYEQLKAKGFKDLNVAKSIDDIEKAAEYFKCPGQNWVYADDQGNIGFWAAVAIPIRKGFSGSLPVPGWDGKYEWQGYVPTDQQPHMRNPARGWIATANNKHVGDDYPHSISHYYAMPDRYLRISEMLTAKDKLGVDDFKQMHGDFLVVLAREWVPLFLEAMRGLKLSETEQRSVRLLENWDMVASADQVAPTLFHATLNSIVKKTFQKKLGEDLYKQYIMNKYTVFNSLRNLVNDGNSDWFDDPETAGRENFKDVITLSFREAVKYLENNLGADVEDWKWGEIHKIILKHPFGRSSALMGRFFNIGPFPIGGSIATVNPQSYNMNEDKLWNIKSGASLRYITDFANRKNSWRVIPAGISGNFMSPHYADQAEMWRKVEYRPFVLDENSVRNDQKYYLKMLPE